MKGANRSPDDPSLADFVTQPSRSLMAELWDLLRHNKKWWLTPIVIVLFLLGVLVVIGGTAAAPFIYTLF